MASEAADVAVTAIRACIATQTQLLDDQRVESIVLAANALTGSLARGGKLLFFGNGGSASDAHHLAAEFVGRFQRERRALPALSLATNLSAVTAIANDFGFEQVFARQVEALGGPADVAIAISTGGRSPNVLRGVEAARRVGMATIGLTGADGGELAAMVDVCVRVPAHSAARIQESHILIGHVLCELVECDLA